MIHLKTWVSLVTVLIAVVPVIPQEDPESLPVDEPDADVPAADVSTAGGHRNQPHWLTCAKRCKKNCLGKRNEKRCATNFVSQRCVPFGRKVKSVVLTKCTEAIECENKGMKVCQENLQCVLQEQCCVGCSSKYRCLNHWCAAKGSPSFTLTWSGFDDLDLFVITPNGDELSWANDFDADSGGRFQHDDVPDVNTTWQETVYFPLDRSAPEGIYEFYVYNNHEDPDPARPYSITIFDGERRIATKRGTVENQYNSTIYKYDFVF